MIKYINASIYENSFLIEVAGLDRTFQATRNKNKLIGEFIIMIRNEKGQFVSENKNEVTEEKKNVEVIDYDAEIKAAEAKLAELKKAQVAKIEEEKKTAALARKTEANVVNEAIDKYEEAKVVCNRKIKEAYEEYKAKVSAAEKELSQVETEADDKLNKFLESHPEGFHYTFRSKDGKVVRDYDYRTKKYDVFDSYDLLQEAFNNFNKLLNF